MLKQLTRKLFILSALVACLTWAVPSTPAQGSGYSLSGNVWYQGIVLPSGPVIYPYVHIYKWNGSSWVYHGYANSNCCGVFSYDTGGPGRFMGEVNGWQSVGIQPCGFTSYGSTYMYGSFVAELSAAYPTSGMYISTWSWE